MGNKPLQKKFDKLTIQLLEHRCRYYYLDKPTIDDYQYDMMEKEWYKLGEKLGLDMDLYPNWVGFDWKHPLAKEAIKNICDCEEQTERFSCDSRFGKAHCPQHCGLCHKS